MGREIMPARTIEAKLQKLADKFGAEFIHDKDWHVYELWLSNNEYWLESGCSVISECYGTDYQSWKNEAYAELLESTQSGKWHK
jgi:hypothetical protein